MSRAVAHTLALGVLVTAGCGQQAPTGVTTPTTNAPLSLKLLDGVVARKVPIQVSGKEVEATIFPKDLGKSALFLCYYTLPSAAEDKQACDVAINAEVDRCVANTGAEVVSRKAISATEHPTLEVLAKSPKDRSHTIRFRVICTGKEIQSLTAITPNTQDARQSEALDAMFEEFDAK